MPFDFPNSHARFAMEREKNRREGANANSLLAFALFHKRKIKISCSSSSYDCGYKRSGPPLAASCARSRIHDLWMNRQDYPGNHRANA